MKQLPIVVLAAVSLAAGTGTASIVTSFDIDLSPDTQGFAANAATGFALNYTIDSVGNIALDAVFSSGGGARWNQIDNASAGSTTSSELFNTSFTLTYSGSANAFLTYNPSYNIAGTGSVLSTQGEGNVNALENGEFITFTVSGTSTQVSGFSLDLVSFSYDLRIANGGSSFGVEDTSGTVIEQLIPNTSLDGTISGTGISLAPGEAMTFRTIDGNAGGAGLSGFEFTVTATAVPEPATVALLSGLASFGFLVWRRFSLRNRN